ncbi:hypothetical protein DYQ86_04545 [Acidobacteria bacterium AB60]|nr:hypothetical protein DYQ86_04545 [Acidobacteria bacterium AB60]
MNATWIFPVAMAYSGKVPAAVDAEILRLRRLFAERCRGPYDATGVKFGLAVFVQGIDEIKPMKRRGIRVEPFRNNLIIASIYVHRVDWEVPLIAFQSFLWRSAEDATWQCIDRLKKRGLSIAEERLRNDLSVVRREFAGDYLESSGLGGSLTPGSVSAEGAPSGNEEDEEYQLVIQYRTDRLNPADQLEKKHALEQLLGSLLESADLGYCDGGDIGSGTLNIFCFVKPRRNAEKRIVETLRKHNFLNEAVIAESLNGEEKVIWPADSEGEFHLFSR